MSKFIRIYWTSILFTCLILFLSFMNPISLKSVPKFQFEDKLVHLFLYFAYSYVLLRDSHKAGEPSKIRLIVQTMLLPVAIGGLIEFLQVSFFPPRTAEWMDWVADILGVILVWIFFAYKGKKILLL